MMGALVMGIRCSLKWPELVTVCRLRVCGAWAISLGSGTGKTEGSRALVGRVPPPDLRPQDRGSILGTGPERQLDV